MIDRIVFEVFMPVQAANKSAVLDDVCRTSKEIPPLFSKLVHMVGYLNFNPLSFHWYASCFHFKILSPFFQRYSGVNIIILDIQFGHMSIDVD